MRGIGAIAITAFALMACSPQAPAQNASLDDSAQTGLARTNMVVHSATGDHAFQLDVAETPAAQERGLMFRRSLGPNEGMMFPYAPPRDVAFWMKNTWIPLDIIFVRADGTIARITTAKPMDLTPVGSGEPVAMVIEIPGGRAAQLGIRPGDRVGPPPPCCKR